MSKLFPPEVADLEPVLHALYSQAVSGDVASTTAMSRGLDSLDGNMLDGLDLIDGDASPALNSVEEEVEVGDGGGEAGGSMAYELPVTEEAEVAGGAAEEGELAAATEELERV